MVATSTPTLENSAPAVSLATVKEPPEKQTLSQSFFKSLVGFLRSR
jgi:hypothetical protein